jgi:hypothetical protein
MITILLMIGSRLRKNISYQIKKHFQSLESAFVFIIRRIIA